MTLHAIYLIGTTFISIKYLTFQNVGTISNGFKKIKDKKMEVVFIIIRKFTIS